MVIMSVHDHENTQSAQVVMAVNLLVIQSAIGGTTMEKCTILRQVLF